MLWRKKKRQNVDIAVIDAEETESGGGRRIIWMTLMSVAAFVGWASFAEIDQVTRAPAQVIPTSRTQVVQSAEGGVIEEMLVRAGDEVVVFGSGDGEPELEQLAAAAGTIPYELLTRLTSRVRRVYLGSR